MQTIIIIALIIIIAVLALTAYVFYLFWKECGKRWQATKEYYSTILADQNDTISGDLPEDGKCPLGMGKCWRATGSET